MFQNGTCAFFFQFSRLKDIGKVLGYSRSLGAEQICYLLLCEPHGFILEAHLKFHGFVWLIEHYFVVFCLFHVQRQLKI